MADVRAEIAMCNNRFLGSAEGDTIAIRMSRKTIWKQIEYIHANPVRRGLCRCADNWYWSSAGVYAGLREGPLSIDKASLPSVNFKTIQTRDEHTYASTAKAWHPPQASGAMAPRLPGRGHV